MKVFLTGLFFGLLLVFGFNYFQKEKPQVKPVVVTKTEVKSSFSIENAPAKSLKGTIDRQDGMIFWESRIATEPAKLINNPVAQQGEKYITKENSNLTLKFDKFGTIAIYPNSDLSLVQTLPIDFVVSQNAGQIKYVVDGSTPLSIRFRNALITKSSGVIEVTIKKDDPVVMISTVSGEAQIGFNDLDFISTVFTLKEGQVYRYNSGSRILLPS